MIQNKSMLKLFTLVVAVAVSLTGIGNAESIKGIKVIGNERVEDATVLTYLPFGNGDDFDANKVGDVIKTLYATGLFHKVDVRWDDAYLFITVLENPLVNKVAIEGNDSIDASRITEALVLDARSVFTPAKAQRDAQMIEDMYRSRGRFLTKVKPQIIGRDQNRVDVVYEVEEGEKTKVKNINFIGNKRFSDADLKEIIATKESAWWRLLGGGDTYDPNRMDVDKEFLRRHYLQHGYADFQVQSAVAEISRNQEEFYLTFTVTEGPKYDFGEVSVKINADDENLIARDLEQELTLKAGELYNAKRVENNVEKIVDVLGTKGFAFLDVQPEFKRNEADRLVDVAFAINPGPRVYVNRINIEGNTRTRDHVIRREMRLAEGDAYSSNKLKRSKDRVNRLGFFKDVKLTQTETESPDRIDVNVKVEEQSTGEFNVGAGFSTYEGLLASADIRERNFLGKGQDLALKFAVSEVKQSYRFSFTEPYFLEQDLAAGVDVFNEQSDLQDESSYDLDNTGAALRFRVPINEFSTNSTSLGFKETKISNVGSAASPLVAREAGKRSSMTLGNTYAIDTRDSFLTPTEGYRLSVTGEYSGFGSDVDYLRGSVSGSWHKELFEDIVLSVGARAGAISDLGGDLPIYEHFNAGGTTLRGFELSGIGPRDSNTNDALGGMYMLGNNIEVSFPLGNALKDLGVKGVIFSDGGIVTEFEDATSIVQDSSIYRVSVGAGVHWHSPLGPLRLEFGVPIVKAEEDQTQVFSFSVGSRF
ncbi:MAG: outer membrane protein assembly factor BamA [Alphaproteobacteria bacterium]|nr:outer membrane protein assembly factor BamA [Alphaproteobacteria bacterium]